MVMITAIIPTKDRPVLLKEAIQSLRNQTLLPAEIIVVDDGSAPPVDADALICQYGSIIRVIRNEESLGLAYSRNLGVEAAMGEYVVHLDDDDLFAPKTLTEGYELLSNDPQLDVVFLGARGFGARADHFNRVQSKAVACVKALGMGQEVAPGLVYFGRDIMSALLQTVPSAFQHVMLRRETWSRISALRWRSYQIESEMPDDEAAKRCITGPLRDSEWALYAGALCRKTVLIDRPRYLARCEGQGYSSQPANRELHILQSLRIKAQLFRASLSLPELRDWKRPVRDSLAAALFCAAWYYFHNGRRWAAYGALINALKIHPKAAYFRFGLRMLLPCGNAVE